MIKNKLLLGIAFFSLVCASCKKDTDVDTSTGSSSPNILLIIADDLGKDAIKGYSEGSIKPNTPNIDAFRSKGLTFNNFWSNPVCSPTRASLLTGKYGYRTNVKGASDILSPSETSLQKYINDNSSTKYATAIIGKWHLAGNNSTFNPETMGIDYYSGLIRGAVTDYYNWQLTEDGSTNTQNTYITEALTTTSINWINQQTKPWFLWLAYNAPHTPFHVPPSNMHGQGNLPTYTNGLNATPYYVASIEAMDFQIGR
jgi:arylsulfatase B